MIPTGDTEMQQPTKDEMVNVLERQQTDFLEEGAVAFKTRIDRLERVINILKSNESRLIDAMSTDFGHRSMHQSLFTDIAGSIGPLRIAQKQLKDWIFAIPVFLVMNLLLVDIYKDSLSLQYFLQSLYLKIRIILNLFLL